MSWIDVPFPPCIAFGAQTGVEWSTDIARNDGGFEQRTGRWIRALQSYDIGFAVRTASDYAEIKAHFNTMRGQLNKFPFQDPLDHLVSQAESGAEAVAGTVNQFQLQKVYDLGTNPYRRPITRPRGTVVIYRNGTPATAGAGAGQYALDVETGRVTFVADQTRSITSHAVGADHQFTFASAFSPNVGIGETIFVSGVTGTAAPLLNDQPLTVTAVAGGVVSVDVTTTGLTASGGAAARRAIASELQWSGEFIVPCRYGISRLPGAIINRQGGIGELLVQCDAIMVVEVRE